MVRFRRGRSVPTSWARSRTGSRSTPRRSRALLVSVALAATLTAAAPASAHAQRTLRDSTAPRASGHATTGERVVASVGVVALAAALDGPARTALRDRGHDGAVLRALSSSGNALGTASHLVPAMAAAYAVTLLAGAHDASNRVIAVATGYAAADLAAGVLKESVGRERPFVHGDPTRFHPFTSHGDDHSFPSGHVTHIVALATGAAMESNRAWVRDAGIGASVLVGWQRIHADQHWTSDVLAAALLSNALSGATTRAVEHALRRR